MRSLITPFAFAAPLLLAAQKTHSPTLEHHHKSRSIAATPAGQQQQMDARDAVAPLWHEDFEGGLGGWQVATQTGPVNWQLTSTGNTNGFTPGPLQSTTGSPGGHWIVADSDAEGTDGVPENTTITSLPILGFDTVHYMLLQFEQSFRQLNTDRTLVEVSGNGGFEWTTFPVNESIGGNLSTPGAPLAQMIRLNISNALAGGSHDIRIRFRWISEQGFAYSWQVDDVSLLPVRHNDLVLSDATHAAWDLSAPDYSGMACTIYPVNETRMLNFRGMIGNNGDTMQTNVRLRVDVDGPDANDVTLYSNAINIAPAMVDSLFITGYTPPAILGNYAFHISLEQDHADDVPEDNSLDRHIRVDPYLFARDETALVSERDDNGFDYELGNRFYVQDYNETLHAVDVALGPHTEVGAAVSATVYDGSFNYVGESAEYTVQAGDINNYGDSIFIRLPLLTPTLLIGESDYVVCAHAQGGSLWTGISGSSVALTSLIHRFSPEHWYYVTTTPMVRMNFSPFAGVQENDASTLQLAAAPTVFSTSTSIRFKLESAGTASWELRDLSGRVVRTEELGTLAAGEHRIPVNGEELASGVYIFTLHTGTIRSSLRLVRAGL